MKGMNPDKMQTQMGAPKMGVPHKNTMSNGGGKTHKGTMGTGSSSKKIYGAMGKNQHTGNGGG